MKKLERAVGRSLQLPGSELTLNCGAFRTLSRSRSPIPRRGRYNRKNKGTVYGSCWAQTVICVAESKKQICVKKTKKRDGPDLGAQGHERYFSLLTCGLFSARRMLCTPVLGGFISDWNLDKLCLSGSTPPHEEVLPAHHTPLILRMVPRRYSQVYSHQTLPRP